MFSKTYVSNKNGSLKIQFTVNNFYWFFYQQTHTIEFCAKLYLKKIETNTQIFISRSWVQDFVFFSSIINSKRGRLQQPFFLCRERHKIEGVGSTWAVSAYLVSTCARGGEYASHQSTTLFILFILLISPLISSLSLLYACVCVRTLPFFPCLLYSEIEYSTFMVALMQPNHTAIYIYY